MRSKDGRAADQRSGARSDGGGPPASDTRSVPYSMPAVTFSLRHRTLSESKPVTFTSLIVMSPCLKRQQHSNSVSFQMSLSIYVISNSLHAFLLISSIYRVCIIEFCVLLHLIRFNIWRIILKSILSHSYAELSGYNIRSEYKERSRARSRSRRQS